MMMSLLFQRSAEEVFRLGRITQLDLKVDIRHQSM